ncbi:S1 family peptidase [Tsukamurella sp. PLM1]|uniref:S1 family peptidase n=1 Tax=Tsukamurella sp. PLM1 TaxID=2929795 RepID=UPI0020BFC9B3|nr:S1 family peptidase [Tsukamurella sp. PLM1]
MRRRHPASTAGVLTGVAAATLLAGCEVIQQDDRVVPEAPSPSTVVVTTPIVSPYPVVAPERPAAVAPLPTTGAGITTYADPFGVYASVCTLGFFGRYPGGQVVAFTAGHCAELARQARPTVTPVARYLTSGGRNVPFGEYIKATRTARGQDIAIIQVQGENVRPEAAAIGKVTGYSTAEELRAGRPEICIVGARTGRHCGVLDSVDRSRVTWAGIPAIEGDSGGPVYAKWPDGSFTAVGVVNSVHTRTDGTGTGGGTGTLIADDMTANRITLMGTR